MVPCTNGLGNPVPGSLVSHPRKQQSLYSKTAILLSCMLHFLRFCTLFVWSWPNAHKNSVSQILHNFSLYKDVKLGLYSISYSKISVCDIESNKHPFISTTVYSEVYYNHKKQMSIHSAVFPVTWSHDDFGPCLHHRTTFNFWNMLKN